MRPSQQRQIAEDKISLIIDGTYTFDVQTWVSFSIVAFSGRFPEHILNIMPGKKYSRLTSCNTCKYNTVAKRTLLSICIIWHRVDMCNREAEDERCRRVAGTGNARYRATLDTATTTVTYSALGQVT